MIADWQFVRFGLFVSAVVVTYWLAFRWVLDRFRGNTSRSRLDHCFHSNWMGGVLLSLAGLGIVCMAYGLLLEPRRVKVTTYTVETPKLPPGQRLRLVHLADLHVREDGPREQTLPDIVRSLHPDVILHTGDFFGTRTDVNSIIVKLLHSWDVPQYASGGNLDDLGDFEGCMKQADVIVPDGGVPKTCSVRGVRLSISGFPSGMEGVMRSSLDRLPRDTFNIVLYHHPQGFSETWDTPADLMLAGHTHGGQIRLPGYGALITLDRYGKRWESGLFDEHSVKLVVSRGLGCEPDIPEMRFCCSPEVVVIDLIGRARHQQPSIEGSHMNRLSRRDTIKGLALGAVAGLGAPFGFAAGSVSARGAEVQKRAGEAKPVREEIVWSRKVPVRHVADVAVIGGGIAGVAAACAAVKSGAKVVLVERFAITGGNMTTGGVASFCGETAGQGEVFDEILTDMEKFKAVAPYKPYPQLDHRVFDHHILAIVLQELLLRRKVKLLFHTRFVDVRVTDGGRITECIVCGKSGPEALRAKQFIDCTGDADVARTAGFATMKGRPEDGLQLPMSMMFFVRHVEEGLAGAQLPEGWFQPCRTPQELPMTSVWPNGPRSNAIKVKIPMFDSTDTESLTAAEVRARRRAWEVLDYYQRRKAEPWRYDGCSPQIGIREGARIVGDYVLALADLRAARKFDDAIARGVYYLDGHRPNDDKRTYILKKDEMKVPPYQIPLRSLIAKDGANLLMAGRCFSAEQLALSSARVSTSCAMMGQAAGIAAALSAQKQCDVRKLDPQAVRRIIEERGARLAV